VIKVLAGFADAGCWLQLQTARIIYLKNYYYFCVSTGSFGSGCNCNCPNYLLKKSLFFSCLHWLFWLPLAAAAQIIY
jgi:hypothetical protein